MSEHKVYKDKKNDLVNKNRTKKILSITKKFMITVAVVLFLNQAVAFITGYNLIWSGVKYILNAVDIYTEPVESITFESDGWKNNVPGSWQITKSAHWTGIDTAVVNFTLNTKEKEIIEEHEEVIPDVILVLDTSLSMEGQKLDKVKEHSKGFVQTYLTKHPDKTIAVVDFDDEGRIVISFTSDIAKLQAAIDTLVASGNTNYNDALKRVDELMQIGDYAERNVGVLFLTDGVPCIDTPSEVATFKMIKEKYELIAFNGIQYEMGTSITQQLRDISDFYKYANMNNLSDIFVELTQKTLVYEKFVITDYVKDKYFYINDASDISAYYCGGELGTVELINESDGGQKVVWDLGNEYKTGSCPASMSIQLTLREEYVNEYEKDFYPTNKGEEATYQIEEENEYTKKSNDTPVLQRIYTVTYENNPPTGCKLPAINTTENHYFSETVSMIDNQPSCSGYLFKGWEFVTSVESIGNDKFTMPTKDVTLRAKWGKQAISKTMNGTTGEKPSLFDIAKGDGNNENGVGVYTGLVSDKFNVNSPSENATIYYYTSKEGNNVVFANICWQIVRTTSSGGIKLIYNGPYDEKLKCSEERSGNYMQIGTSAVNYSRNSPADVGYMYNKRYVYGYENVILDTTLWGESVSYNNGVYTLLNTKYGTADETHHYTCADGSSSCSNVRYNFRDYDTSYYYITLNGAKDVDEALKEMIGSDDYNDEVNDTINKTSSVIKSYIDDWYQKNIDSKNDSNGLSFTNYLEDVVFCNDRTIREYGGWKSGEAKNGYLRFNYYSVKDSYECPRLIDQFSVSNTKAKLTYPVGLLTYPEGYLMGSTLRTTGPGWWMMSPDSFGINLADWIAFSFVFNDCYYGVVNDQCGVRPSVSLKPGTKATSGNGTTIDPYIVDKPAA